MLNYVAPRVFALLFISLVTTTGFSNPGLAQGQAAAGAGSRSDDRAYGLSRQGAQCFLRNVQKFAQVTSSQGGLAIAVLIQVCREYPDL